MRQLAVLTCATAIVVGPMTTPGAAHHRPNAYCSPSGDFCIEAKRIDGVRKLRIDTFAHRGRYRLCVWKRSNPEYTRECKRFRLRAKGGGIRGDTVRWRKAFTHRGPGQYLVRWKKGGSNIGPRLGFHAK
jgi:hypothetical protein